MPEGLRRKGYKKYFQSRPDVTGMATDDGQVLLNPNSNLTPQEQEAVIANERSRILMRSGQVPRPTFTLTPTQNEYFQAYSTDIQDVRETIAARILSGDPSAHDFTPEQLQYVIQNLGLSRWR